jgi:dolichyl-phosphate-mannose--protein O-mannosyl transferase
LTHKIGLHWWEWLLLATGMLAFAAQAALASPLKSAAFDEEYHIAAGYAYLKTGDFRMSTSHPPLVNALSALPLLRLDTVHLPLDHPSWAESDYFIFSDVFLWQANEDAQGILVNGRFPIILLGVLLTAVLFFWARQMGGPAAGWIALILAAFDPNLLANSRLITTDLGLTFFLALTMWRLWCWLERPSRLNLLWTGLLAGLTMATKFTGLMVWPMILGVVLFWRLGGGDWRLAIGASPISNRQSPLPPAHRLRRLVGGLPFRFRPDSRQPLPAAHPRPILPLQPVGHLHGD